VVPRRRTLASLIALALLAGQAFAVARAACDGHPTPPQAPELTIYELRLAGGRRLVLNEALTAYSTGDTTYLPLGVLTRSLEFPIEVEPGERRASGWFLEPTRTFRLDLERCAVAVDGRRLDLQHSGVVADGTDLYIDTDILERWFPLELDAAPARLVVEITPREPLPIEQRLKRRARWGRVSTDRDDVSDYAGVDVPYRMWDWPFVDVTVEGRARHDEAGDRADGRYKVVGTGDLLSMHTNLAVSGTDRNGVQDVFLTMGRSDPDAGLLGPLAAREYAFGDIPMAQDPLIAGNTLGRGVTVSSYHPNRPEEFSRITLRGELPLGWDVELYQDDHLVDYQSGAERDRYDFTDVPLSFGRNRLRLVFYGPQGQVREQTVSRTIGPGMVRPGEQHYRLTAMKERTDERLGEQAPAKGRWLGSYEYGVNDVLSVGAGYKSLALDDGRHDYATANISTALSRIFTTLEYAKEIDGGHAASAQVSTFLGPLSLTAETARFHGFRSERTEEDGPGDLQARNELRLSNRFPPWHGLWFYLAGELRDEQWSQGDRHQLGSRFSVSGRRWRFTHNIDDSRVDTDSVSSEQTSHRILLSTRWGRTSLRGEVVQQLRPERELTSMGLSPAGVQVPIPS
jgi:hypothetical protein